MSIVALVLALFAPQAHATNICGLTQGEVEDVIAHYNLDTNYQTVSASITAPFNCSLYGDLCGMMGSARAETWTCNRWADFKDHVYPSSIAVNAAGDLEAKETAFTVATYPGGIPDDATYWFDGGGGCVKKETATSGNHRAITKSFYTLVPMVFYSIGGHEEAFARAGVMDPWTRDNAASVWIANDFESTGSYGTCTGSDSKSDTDGFVSKYEWYVGDPLSIGLFEYVNSDGNSSDAHPDNTCRTAPWNDIGCW